MTLLLESAARTLALAAVAALGIRLMKVRAPQVRHLIWTVVLAGSLSMPALTELLREWSRPVATPVAFVVSDVARVATEATPPLAKTYWWELYLCVTGVLLLRVILGVVFTWRIAKRARVWDGQVRISTAVRGPVTFGRTILLPESYKQWEASEREAVLRHEFAHCERGDFYTQLLAKIHRAVFWFNPLAWWLDRHLADLAEQVCDDAAVQSPKQCPAYAELLLRFAAGADWRTEAGVAMARVSSVSRRIERLLDEAFEPGRRMSSTRKLQVLGCALPLALLPALLHPQLVAQSKNERSFAITSPDHKVHIHGDIRELKKAQDLRAARGRDVLWIRQGRTEYVVDDPKIVDEARAIFHHDTKLEAEIEALGQQQEELGRQQELLGNQQEQVTIDVPALDDAELRELTKRFAELKARKKVSQEELGELQGKLGELQAKLAELQGLGGERQAKFSKKQAELGAKQSLLGARQGEIGARLGREAEKATARLNALIDKLIAEGKAERLP